MICPHLPGVALGVKARIEYPGVQSQRFRKGLQPPVGECAAPLALLVGKHYRVIIPEPALLVGALAGLRGVAGLAAAHVAVYHDEVMIFEAHLPGRDVLFDELTFHVSGK